MKVIDTETNGGALDNNLTNVWAVGVYDTETKEYSVFHDPTALHSVLTESSDPLIFHNAPFDLWVIHWFCGYLPPSTRVLHDTVILDYLLCPDRLHSLKECAKRAGTFKMDSPDFDELSDEMLVYLKQDVLATWEVFCDLYPKLNRQLHIAYEIEQKFLLPMTALNHNGVKIDSTFWEVALAELITERDKVREEILKLIPLIEGQTVVTKRLRASETVCVSSDLEEGKYVFQETMSDGRHAYKKVEPFNPGSADQRVAALKKLYGWEPTVMTKTGKAKCNKDVLKHLTFPLACLFRRSQDLDKIYTTYGETLLDKVHGDGRIYTHFNGVNTLTGRLTSSSPSLQTIPSSGVGASIRKMFVASEGKVLVGTDLDQSNRPTLDYM